MSSINSVEGKKLLKIQNFIVKNLIKGRQRRNLIMHIYDRIKKNKETKIWSLMTKCKIMMILTVININIQHKHSMKLKANWFINWLLQNELNAMSSPCICILFMNRLHYLKSMYRWDIWKEILNKLKWNSCLNE